jgi:hypothetical protein
MREFGARYDEEMETDWLRILKGYREGTNTPEDNMHVEGHWRMNLTYQLLKDDLIEKYGFIESSLFQGSKDSALQALCRRIIDCAKADSKIVDNTIRDFAGRGYLSAAVSDQDCLWSWSI